jgi:NitT/TauT family transport system permease protein
MTTELLATTGPPISGARLRTVLAPVILGLLVVLGWQLLIMITGVEPFILPAPLDIGRAIAENLDTIVAGMIVTGRNALIGLIGGTIVGTCWALLANASMIIDRMSAPVIAALAVMPIVALAPVLYTMFGADQDTARMLVAGLAVVIPVFVNLLRGLRQVLPVHRDLMRSYAASGWQIARTVTLPTAWPYLFTGLRIGSSLAVISALVAEYFGGRVGGLGKSITTAAASSNYPLAWAYVAGSIVLGLTFYLATLAFELVAGRHRT